MKNQLRLLLIGLGMAITGVALGQSACESQVSSYSSAVSSGDAALAAQIQANHPQCFPGGTASAQIQINATSFQQISAVSTILSSRLLGVGAPGQRAGIETKGMAAGGQPKPWNAWANVTGNDTRQNYTTAAGVAVKNDADVTTAIVGADYTLAPGMVVGVSAAFDRTSGSGSNSIPGSQSTSTADGYSVAPYFGMQLTKEWALDVTAGLGRGDMTMDSITKADADRLFAGANLTYNRWMNNIQLMGKLGYLHAEEKYGDSATNGVANPNTASTNKIDQLRMGVQAGYWMNGVMPYAGLAYTSDVNRSTTLFGAPNDPIGKDAWVWTVGANFFSLASGVTGGIVYNQEENRSSQKNSSLSANINIRF